MKVRLGLLALCCLVCPFARAADPIVVGSKIFTEGYVLGELAAQSMEAAQPTLPVTRKFGMGSTGILFTALQHDAIDVYADYTGTLAEALLKDPHLKSIAELQPPLAKLGIVTSASLGFANTYALAVREDDARRYRLQTISDLARMPGLRAGFSFEFMDRADGYPGLAQRYGLEWPAQRVSRMEHSLTYEAISQHAVDVIDVYSTDAKIRKFKLRLLRDDLRYFPSYEAVWVARAAFVRQHPLQWRALRQWEGSLSEADMQRLNAEVDLDKRNVAQVAAGFRGQTRQQEGWAAQLGRRTAEHLWLVGLALAFSVFIGVPLGFVAARNRRIGQLILTLSAIIQTVPSLALLCFLIPLLGIGTKPALAALCLYSLLPVVLNTFTGLRSVDARHLENARAFGLTASQVILHVELPLASPALLAGIQTATIVSIGTATLAALVGAGGYGVPIVTGLSLNDVPTILTGAIPAAVMAWVAHLGFSLAGRFVIPAGLRVSARG